MKKIFGILLALTMLAGVTAVTAGAEGTSNYRAAICVNDKWGYMDENGVEIVPYKYDYAYDFSGGMAGVESEYGYNYIDKDGNELLTTPYFSGKKFSEGYALVYKDVGKPAFIDKKGNEVLVPPYEEVNSFKNGLAMVANGGKYGFIDIAGTEVIPLIYDKAEDFDEGMAAVWLGNTVGFIDTTGEVVIPFAEIDNTQYAYEDSMMGQGEHLELVYMSKYEKEGSVSYGDVGFIDLRTRKLIIPCIYEKAYRFSNGVAPVCKNGKWGYIDKTGAEVIPFIYDKAQPFWGEATVAEKNGKKICIDLKGNELFELTSVQSLYALNGGYGLLWNEDVHGYDIIDKNGKTIRVNIMSGGTFSRVAAPISVTLNGNAITFDQEPIIQNNRTLVPFRAICEAMGAEVEWDANTRQVKATLNNVELVFTIDNNVMTVNGNEKVIDQAPIIKNGRTLLPARAFAEELGATVGWESETKTVTIIK